MDVVTRVLIRAIPSVCDTTRGKWLGDGFRCVAALSRRPAHAPGAVPNEPLLQLLAEVGRGYKEDPPAHRPYCTLL